MICPDLVLGKKLRSWGLSKNPFIIGTDLELHLGGV